MFTFALICAAITVCINTYRRKRRNRMNYAISAVNDACDELMSFNGTMLLVMPFLAVIALGVFPFLSDRITGSVPGGIKIAIDLIALSMTAPLGFPIVLLLFLTVAAFHGIFLVGGAWLMRNATQRAATDTEEQPTSGWSKLTRIESLRFVAGVALLLTGTFIL